MGVFFGLMIPIAQIPAAAIASLLLRGNLWIAAVSTLVSNPLTYGPLYYFAYRLGAGVIGRARRPTSPQRPSSADAHDRLARPGLGLDHRHRPAAAGRHADHGGHRLLIAYWGTQLVWRMRVTAKWRRLRASVGCAPQQRAGRLLEAPERGRMLRFLPKR
jgi:hypothetical protein